MYPKSTIIYAIAFGLHKFGRAPRSRTRQVHYFGLWHVLRVCFVQRSLFSWFVSLLDLITVQDPCFVLVYVHVSV
jgi:hypothetical protein